MVVGLADNYAVVAENCFDCLLPVALVAEILIVVAVADSKNHLVGCFVAALVVVAPVTD